MAQRQHSPTNTVILKCHSHQIERPHNCINIASNTNNQICVVISQIHAAKNTFCSLILFMMINLEPVRKKRYFNSHTLHNARYTLHKLYFIRESSFKSFLQAVASIKIKSIQNKFGGSFNYPNLDFESIQALFRRIFFR